MTNLVLKVTNYGLQLNMSPPGSSASLNLLNGQYKEVFAISLLVNLI